MKELLLVGANVNKWGWKGIVTEIQGCIEGTNPFDPDYYVIVQYHDGETERTTRTEVEKWNAQSKEYLESKKN